MKSLFSLLDRTLGRCPRCVCLAFLAALSASVLAIAFLAVRGSSMVTTMMMAAAIALTALWLAHVAAMALRVAIAARRNSLPASSTAPASSNRRRFLAEFARAASVAAFGTALMALAGTVLGQGRCDCSRCRPDQYCCPTANGYCGCFPMPCP